MTQLRRFIPASLYFRLFRWRHRDRIQTGLPPGLDISILNTYCQEKLGDGLAESSFLRISGWKTHGAYRIFFRTASGKDSSLIFKHTDHSDRQIPAAQGLPVEPGPPEYTIYRHRSPRLAFFLPNVHFCEEIGDESGFKYLLEDLRPAYRPIENTGDIKRAAQTIPALHQAIQSLGNGMLVQRMIRFDGDYFPKLLDYANESLNRYRIHGFPELIDSVVALGGELVSYHKRLSRHGLGDFRSLIHGDYNRSNIHIPVKSNRHIKIVDWEWAGYGYPHADFVALTKHTTRKVDLDILEIICVAYPALPRKDHIRLFRWCQIERGLLDAAFMAHLFMGGNQTPWVSGYVSASLKLVLRAYEHLPGMSGQH